ncbi:hypothetical protein SAMN05216467_2052 [Cellulomonas sp. KH9]|nr:hypothetical protein SAMN05216467_2052 [Cellulomonas sp. KH9]
MTSEDTNANASRSQNVYRAGRRGAAWTATDAPRSQSGTLTAARKLPAPSKPLRLKEPKKAG